MQAWWLARPGFDLDKALGDPCEALATAEGGLRFAGELAVNVGLIGGSPSDIYIYIQFHCRFS